jgi:hypothetical protein
MDRLAVKLEFRSGQDNPAPPLHSMTAVVIGFNFDLQVMIVLQSRFA